MPIRIVDREYKVKVLHGRLYLNGEEYKSLIDHDAGEIRISDLLPSAEQADLVAEAVSSIYQQLLGQFQPLPVGETETSPARSRLDDLGA